MVRLVWGDYYKSDLPLPVQPAAFEPRKTETDGISVFRLACLNAPEDALAVIAAEKRARYAIALVPVSEIQALGMSVQPAPIPELPGHAVLPELNVLNAKADKVRWRTVQKQLAAVASRNVIPPAPQPA